MKGEHVEKSSRIPAALARQNWFSHQSSLHPNKAGVSKNSSIAWRDLHAGKLKAQISGGSAALWVSLVDHVTLSWLVAELRSNDLHLLRTLIQGVISLPRSKSYIRKAHGAKPRQGSFWNICSFLFSRQLWATQPRFYRDQHWFLLWKLWSVVFSLQLA